MITQAIIPVGALVSKNGHKHSDMPNNDWNTAYCISSPNFTLKMIMFHVLSYPHLESK